MHIRIVMLLIIRQADCFEFHNDADNNVVKEAALMHYVVIETATKC